MASNRKFPFGYRMELGKIVIHPKETLTVQYIFQQYALGASYSELLRHLRKQDVEYDQGKLWNKNMVARILENRKYTGQPGWPPIIDADMFECANEKRSSKVSPPQRSDAQKVLRRLSGGYSANVEQAVLCLLNLLIAETEQIITPQPSPANLDRAAELRSALERELEQQPINENAAKRLAMELASVQYEGIGGQEYVTVHSFEYAHDKHGKPYGWGIAKYAITEDVLGADVTRKAYNRTPEESKKLFSIYSKATE